MKATKHSEERRRAENEPLQRVIESRRQDIDAILEGAGIILFRVDADGVITPLSGEGMESLAGTAGDHMNQLGMNCPASGAFREALAGRPASCVLRMETGKVLRMSFSPSVNREEKTDGVVGVAVDITEWKHAEEQRKMLQELNRVVSEADGVSQALEVMLSDICRIERWTCGEVWLPSTSGWDCCSSPVFWCRDQDQERLAGFRDVSRNRKVTLGEGVPGRAFESRRVEMIADISDVLPDPGRQAAVAAGIRAAVVLPVHADDRVFSVLLFFLSGTRGVGGDILHWLEGVGAQAGALLEKQRIAAETQRYLRRLRAAAVRLSKAEEEERRRIAKGLHDGVGQILSLARIKAGALRADLSAEFEDQITSIASLIEEADEQTRSLTFQLSPPILYELGFEPAVEWLTDCLQQDHGLICEVQSEADPHPLPESLRDPMFQIVRELLHNVTKHADAQKVHLVIHRANNLLRVDVEDDGRGFDTQQLQTMQPPSGFGLFTIRERAESLGGHFDVVSRRGQGTRVSVVVPVTLDAMNALSGETPGGKAP